MSACVTCHTLQPSIAQHSLAAHQSRSGVLNSKGGNCVLKKTLFLFFAVVTHHMRISGDTADVKTQFVYTCQVASSSISTGVLSSNVLGQNLPHKATRKTMAKKEAVTFTLSSCTTRSVKNIAAYGKPFDTSAHSRDTVKRMSVCCCHIYLAFGSCYSL